MMERGDVERHVQSSPSVRVSRTLAMMLRVSRVLGIAPVSFHKTGTDPPQIIARVSRRHAIYSYILISILNLLQIVPTYIYWTEQTDLIGFIINMFDVSGLLFITSIGVCGVSGRMSRMLLHFDQLNMITSKQPALKINEISEKKITMIVSVILVTDFVSSTIVIVLEGLENFYQVFFAFYSVQTYICLLMMAQIIFMVAAVTTTLNTLLIQLQELPSRVQIGDPDNQTIIISYSNLDKTRKKYFQEICESYEVVRGAVRGLNDTEGALLFYTIAAFTLYCTVSIFNIINFAVLEADETKLYITREVCWSISNVVMLTTLVELCHQAEQKALKIRYMLCDALPEVVAASPVTSWSFKMAVHCDTFLLNRLVFAPLNIVELNRSLVAKVISFIASSLVIIVQYKMSVKT